MAQKKLILIGAQIVALTACSTGRNAISERQVVSSARGESANQVMIREVPDARTKPEFYVKNAELNIKPLPKISSTGSLSSVDDPRSYIMGANLPLGVGSIVEIKTSSNRLEPSADSAPVDKAAAKTDDKASAQVEEAILKSLPNLEPAETATDKPSIIKSFKAKIIEIRENGDAVVVYHRRGIRADQASDILVKAVIPQAALSERENIKTTQLEDVHIRESLDGEITQRNSANWEDEYTLRMSGFDEAKSKSALALDGQRKQLVEAKDRVVAQVKSLGTERQTMAKERTQLLEEKAKSDEKITALEAKVTEQTEEIQKLTPKEEEKPDDAALVETNAKAAKKDAKKDAKSASPAAKPDKTVAKTSPKPAAEVKK